MADDKALAVLVDSLEMADDNALAVLLDSLEMADDNAVSALVDSLEMADDNALAVLLDSLEMDDVIADDKVRYKLLSLFKADAISFNVSRVSGVAFPIKLLIALSV